jgi:hypothetical protein
MIRARFKVAGDDYRPVIWPIKHPYWCSGYDERRAVLVAYADDEAEIMRNWPDAEALDVMQEGLEEYTFTGRFPRPDWMPIGVAKNAPTGHEGDKSGTRP